MGCLLSARLMELIILSTGRGSPVGVLGALLSFFLCCLSSSSSAAGRRCRITSMRFGSARSHSVARANHRDLPGENLQRLAVHP
jgi:hypothetical protein